MACFADRVSSLYEELEGSVVYSRDCAIRDAWHNIDHILRRLEVLEMEAHDLKELQELLEANIVNFDFLKQYVATLTHFIRDTPAGVVYLFIRDTPAGVVNAHGGFIWYLWKLYAPGVTFTIFPTMLKDFTSG